MKPGKAAKPQQTKKTSILDGTTGWNLEVDLGKKLVFPEIVQTNLRPDIILWSETGKNLIMIKLTVPWETNVKRPMRGRKPSIQSFSLNVEKEATAHGGSPLK